jgi:serine/threonine protein kinase
VQFSGGFSFVYLAKIVETQQRIAMKRMLCQDKEMLELARAEIEVMVRGNNFCFLFFC